MTDRQNKAYMQRIVAVPIKNCSDWNRPLLFKMEQPFTRSNGTTISRLYERLTKASRRRCIDAYGVYNTNQGKREEAYRQGLYDAYKALQEELNA